MAYERGSERPPGPAYVPAGDRAEAAKINWQAELMREYGVSGSFERSRPLVSEPPQEVELTTLPALDWQRELLAEHGITGSGRLVGQSLSKVVPAAPAETGPLQRPSVVGYHPRMVPSDFESYKRLVHQVFDARRNQLAAEAANYPVFQSARAVWRPGDVKANLNVLYLVNDHMCALMGRIFRFTPAPLGYTPDLNGAWGHYRFDTRRVALGETLLFAPVEEMFATVIHEQVHALQHEMRCRLSEPSRWPLTPPERALAFYWMREQKRLAWLNAGALLNMHLGKGNAGYRRIGIEYHAYDTEEYVVPRMMASK